MARSGRGERKVREIEEIRGEEAIGETWVGMEGEGRT